MKVHKSITFTVPGKTVSKSNAYRICGKRLRKTKECKDWEAAIRKVAASAHSGEPHEGTVYLKISLYFPDKRRRDIDNPLKSILDAMNGVIYKDDSQVFRIFVEKDIDRDDPRIEVTVSFLD